MVVLLMLQAMSGWLASFAAQTWPRTHQLHFQDLRLLKKTQQVPLNNWALPEVVRHVNKTEPLRVA